MSHASCAPPIRAGFFCARIIPPIILLRAKGRPRTADRTGVFGPHRLPGQTNRPIPLVRLHPHQIARKPSYLLVCGCKIRQFQSVDIVEGAPARDAEIVSGHGAHLPLVSEEPMGAIPGSLPGIWTRSRMEEFLAPNTACTPVKPSLPIVAISMMLPSA
jgi:hypothetical protein